MRRAGGTVPWLFAGLLGANGLAWLWAWSLFADRPALLGAALLAWVYGLRHAVDADHIAAIDNVVRKLMQAGQRPLAAGLWFSLGHSTIVVLASAAVAGAAERLETWREAVGWVGTAVSGGFLLLLAGINVLILIGVWRQFRQARRGEAADTALDGAMGRILRPLMRLVTRSWHMYPLGFLFGMGFDTATEVGLLGISAAQSAAGMGAAEVLVFPALFTAAMALVDTADSVLMVGAYGWALAEPLRKLWYNLTITAASVLVAVLIGGVEVLGLLGERFALEGPFWLAVGAMNENFAYLGYAVVAIFAACWAVSVAVYRIKGFGTAGAAG